MTVDASLGLTRCFDAAYPPLSAPPGYGAVLGYIGGPYAENVWTLEEWQRFGHLLQFPCYVPDLNGDPYDQAVDACTLATRLGWHVGGDRAIVADTETTIGRDWWAVFADTVTGRHFVPVDYGSLGYVLQNAAERIWAADWDDLAVVPEGQTILAGQYESGIGFGGSEVDASVLTPELVRLGGRGVRELS
jgi:hypothetical protein